MTDYYVSDARGDNTTGLSWSTAFTSFTHATVLGASGSTDQVFVADDHTEGGVATLNLIFTGGTESAPLRIYSLDPDNSDAYTPGALIDTTGGNISLNGHLRIFGLDFFANGASRDITIGTNDNSILISDGLIDAGDDLNFTGVETHIRVVNSTINRGDTNPISLGQRTDLTVKDCTITHGATTMLALSDNNTVLIEDSDLSDADNICTAIASVFRQSVVVRRCSLPVNFNLWDGTGPNDGTSFCLVESSNANTDSVHLGLSGYEDILGDIESTTSTYRSGGAFDGTQVNEHSWRFNTTAEATEFWRPLRSPPIIRWIEGGAPITITIYVASSTTLQDDECWMEVSGPDDTATSTSRGFYETTKPGATTTLPDGDPRAAASNLTTSGAGITWNGTGVGTKQEMSISYSPDQSGPLSIRVCLARPSLSNVYIDPIINLS